MRKIALISLLGMTLAVPIRPLQQRWTGPPSIKRWGRRPPFRGTFIVTVSPAPI